MSEPDGTSDFGITAEDREKMRFLSANGSPRGTAQLDDVFKDGPDGPESPTEHGPDEPEPSSEPNPGDADPSPGRTETRERVLTAPEFERLLIGALRIDDDEQALETWSALVILGRLGLRAGELCHFSAEWYDDREQILSIPPHDPCAKGRNGGPCGDCRQAARQRVQHGDDRDVEEIAADYWQPKTNQAVRDIPVGWSARAEEAVLFLCQLHGGWPHAYSTLQRRLYAAVDNAPMLDENATTLHGLRGTAASYHAGNGLDKEALKQMMGWRDDQTPNKYLSINGQMAKRALGRVYR